MKYARLVIAYHGCTREVADALLVGDATLSASTNDWDWLGHGIYFWEFGHQRALDWARQRSDRPAVIGAVIQLTHCLDLLDIEHTQLLGNFTKRLVESGKPLPPNRGGRREADCFAINQLCTSAGEGGDPFDSVRASFHEGDEVFPGSGLRVRSHIQIAVRNPNIILGLFKPNDRNP
ncbi:hypothetical protein ACNOYE_11035 [Nannocystaceae bacterium ST9]